MKLLVVALALFGAFVLLLAVIFVYQRNLLYFPSRNDREARGRGSFTAWRGKDGRFLGYVSAAAAPKEGLLFFHGNAGEAIDREWVRDAVPATTTVFLVEYPGYGAREGAPTESALFAAAEEAFDEAAATQLPVVVMGESLGTGVASHVASVRIASRLVLISPYSAMGDVARVHYPWLPIGLLLRDRYDSVTSLAKVLVPLLIVHGEKDEIIPLALARRLFESYRGPDKTFVALPKVGHNDIVYFLLSAPEAAPFRKFLATSSHRNGS